MSNLPVSLGFTARAKASNQVARVNKAFLEGIHYWEIICPISLSTLRKYHHCIARLDGANTCLLRKGSMFAGFHHRGCGCFWAVLAWEGCTTRNDFPPHSSNQTPGTHVQCLSQPSWGWNV